MKIRFANFLASGGYDGFDNSTFRVSTKETRAFDSQMRLLVPVICTALCGISHR